MNTQRRRHRLVSEALRWRIKDEVTYVRTGRHKIMEPLLNQKNI